MSIHISSLIFPSAFSYILSLALTDSGYEDSGYAITVRRSEHGKVTSSRVNANSGNTVTLTVTPDSGYVLDALTVTDSRGSELKLTDKGDGKYTFTMPSRTVTVKATFAPIPDGEQPCDSGADYPSRAFTDLGTVGTWYHEAVDYVLRHKLMNGYGGGLFGPDETPALSWRRSSTTTRDGLPSPAQAPLPMWRTVMVHQRHHLDGGTGRCGRLWRRPVRAKRRYHP